MDATVTQSIYTKNVPHCAFFPAMYIQDELTNPVVVCTAQCLLPCSLRENRWPFLIFHCPSIFPVVEKAQQEPH